MGIEKAVSKNSSVDVLCALSLFLVFSISSLILITIGAGNYKGILGETNRSFNVNSSLHYIINKLHSYDRSGLVSIIEIDGTQVLELSESGDISGYHTMIYHHDGYIYELLTSKTLSFKIGDGEQILPVSELVFDASGNIITIEITDSDSITKSAVVCLKSVGYEGGINNAQG
ncbi:MAG: DUF4860 domain-containing protein [Oscillospiraceae bacterium]|jgi:hypothetical protein